MSGLIRAFFFHQIMGQKQSRCKSFSSGWVGITARGSGSRLWQCWNASLIGWASGSLFLSECDAWRSSLSRSRSLYLSLPHIWQDLTQSQWPEGRLKWGLGEGALTAFLNFRWPFYSRVWVESAPKNFGGEGCWLGEKRNGSFKL